jgi:hypothetical protein
MIKYRVTNEGGYVEFVSEETANAYASEYGGTVTEVEENAPNTSTIPDVTPRQIKQALVLSGVTLQSIDDALNSLSEPTKSLAKIEWEYSISFQRSRPLVNSVGQMLGWTSQQLDALWIYAGTL